MCLVGSILYLYDALGNKLKKSYGGIDSYYQGSVLTVNEQEVILTGEGRVVNDGGWQYEYDLKDHLGNTRVSFKVDTIRAVPLQYKDYYPFGMEMANWYATVGTPTKFLYNGKELQDEGGLDWYDYGARMYDPALGRFHTQDAFAEKYISMTPYQYAANNPALYIDVNDDSLWINYRNERILYENGNIYNSDGTAYSGKGLNKKGEMKGFLKTTVNALGTISGTAEGGSMVSELQSSDNNFTIVKAASSGFVADNGVAGHATQLMTDPAQAQSYAALQSAGISLAGGSGGTINWNPSGTVLPVVGGTARNGITDLAHEMFHGQQANQGMLDGRMYSGVEREEWGAVYQENLVRSQLGMPLRTHYIKSVDSSTGSVLGGYGSRMITPINTPYLPLYPLIPKKAYVK